MKEESAHRVGLFLWILPCINIYVPVLHRVFKRGASGFRTTFGVRHGPNSFFATRCHWLLLYVEITKQAC